MPKLDQLDQSTNSGPFAAQGHNGTGIRASGLANRWEMIAIYLFTTYIVVLKLPVSTLHPQSVELIERAEIRPDCTAVGLQLLMLSTYSRMEKMAKVPPMTPNFETNPISLVSEASRIIGNWKSSQDYLAETLTPATATFRNLIVPLQEGNNHAAHGLRPLTLLARVSPDPEVRDAARTAEAQMEAAETAALMRIDIAELVTVVFDGHSAPASSNSPGDDLDGEDRHLLTFVHGKYQRSGAGIRDPVTRDRLKSATDQLNELVTEAKKALTEESGGIWLMLTELDGVPEKILQGMKHRAGDGDAGEEVLVTLRKGHLMPAMRNARKENTRRKLYDANESRFPENAGRLTEILKLRHEIARLLGFENHAALKMKERMHDNVSDIQSLLQRTRQMLQSASRMEIYTMLQLKRETDPTTEGLFHWDWSFYAQKLKKQRYSFDTDTFSEYFELWHTLDGMLEIFQELFGVVFKIIGANVWHQDVVVYEAWNSGDDGFLGHLYVDLFSRNGKYDGASHFMIGPVSTQISPQSARRKNQQTSKVLKIVDFNPGFHRSKRR